MTSGTRLKSSVQLTMPRSFTIRRTLLSGQFRLQRCEHVQGRQSGRLETGGLVPRPPADLAHVFEPAIAQRGVAGQEQQGAGTDAHLEVGQRWWRGRQSPGPGRPDGPPASPESRSRADGSRDASLDAAPFRATQDESRVVRVDQRRP